MSSQKPQRIAAVPAPSPTEASDELALDMFYWMTLTRGVEERALNLYRQGRLPGSYYTGRGQEAIAVGIALPLRSGPDGDWLSPWIRDLGSYMVHGVPPWRIFSQFMGKAGSTTRGKDGNLHIGGREWNIPCQVSHMADMIPLTVGAALAYKQRGEPRVALTSFGDAATSRGDFHEGLNIAAVLEVPAVFVAENNGWGYSTPISKQTKVTELHRKAAAYGIPAVSVDGNDVFAVHTAVGAAVEAARDGAGPQFIECRTYRMGGHAAHDRYESYMPMETLAQWSDKDPLKRLEQALTGERGVGAEVLDRIRGRVADEVREAVERAEADEYPDPSEAHQGVYAPDGEGT
ncbi:MAG TPA: thiamine pyrophosphate-dependent dehydrogenase E1 component subunit alpha [Gaiellales bacterium]|nr:thiamine pyrophosphate-dependent dehydrogenase E1 component subunit alpha [Gaiellales bacterium]